MTTNASAASSHFRLMLLTALSLSIGWGIRGNFGHEFGAMIPGALAALAAVLLSGRADWWPRAAYFAFFGALGWSFGGSISYMQVIAYTHSGHSGSVLYGFASLFVIGFLWAAIGGAGTALPAVLDRERLTEFFAPLTVVFGAWLLQDFVVGIFDQVNPDFRHTDPLYWYDTDWLAALVAIAAMLVFAAVRRRFDHATSLILHMAVGWWIGFLLLVVALGLRMTPPRGDNWAGCVGMVAGMFVYLQRHGLRAVSLAALVTGVIGGVGFSGATLFKLVGMKTGWETNWHSVLEQSYGFINGIGVAIAMILLAKRTPAVADEPRARRWTEIYAVAFVLLGVTWLNLSKNPEHWVKTKAIPETLYGMSAGFWFNAAYAVLAVVMIALLIAHQRRPLALVPATAPGRGQLLYLVFLWWIVVGNFERALPGFAPQRLITEGVIFLNAALATFILLGSRTAVVTELSTGFDLRRLLRKSLALGAAGSVAFILAAWLIVRDVYGDEPARHANLHIRFGPNATATTEKPKAGQPHP